MSVISNTTHNQKHNDMITKRHETDEYERKRKAKKKVHDKLYEHQYLQSFHFDLV